MKKIVLFTILFLGFVLNSFAQIPNDSFSQSSLKPCPFDSSQLILTPDDWFAYQTLNDKWDGPMDSTICITFKDTLNDFIIELEQVDASKPVFVKSLMNDSTKVLLEKNSFYTTQTFVSTPQNTLINFSNTCPNDICSGIILGVEIPDSTGTSTDLRMYQGSVDNAFDDFWQACVATEKFDTSYLKEFIYKFSLLGTNTEDRWFAPQWVDFFPFGYGYYDIPRIETDHLLSTFDYNNSDSSFNVNAFEISNQYGWWEHPIMLMYIDSTYPSPEYPSYAEIFPPEDFDTVQQTINLQVQQGQSLIAQPYANIRAGLINGNDSLRHTLNVINNGGDLCVLPFIDVIFGGNNSNNYVHNGGTVNLSGKYSCMQFSEGSKLIVGDDTYFEYGKNGGGMLALRSGGSIEIGNNSTLFIGNTLIMHELKSETESQQIFMELNKGSQLVFGEHAKIHNSFSIDKNMKLNVFMNGGILDDSKLSAGDKMKINRIYPQPPVRISENVKVFPNPINQLLNFSFILRNNQAVEFDFFDLASRRIFSKKENGQKGWNEFQFNIGDFETGIYFVKIKINDDEVTKKIVKVN